MKESFLLYHSFYFPIKDLNDKDKGQLFDAIFQFHMGLEVRDLSPACKIAFRFMESQFDRDSMKYDQIVERNRKNGKNGGRPSIDNPEKPKKPSGLNGFIEKPKKADTDTDTDLKGKGKKKSQGFSPPSLQEFIEYFKTNDYSIEVAERAFKGYEIANWHSADGKPVKNWKQKCQFVWFKPENKVKQLDNQLNINKDWQ